MQKSPSPALFTPFPKKGEIKKEKGKEKGCFLHYILTSGKSI